MDPKLHSNSDPDLEPLFEAEDELFHDLDDDEDEDDVDGSDDRHRRER